MSNDQALSDIDLAGSLDQMAESTTAAELVRAKGQTKKLKVLSERKLMEWITAMLRQHLAGKSDSFTDSEKEELLKRTQEELARRIQREQAADKERDRIQSEMQRVMAQISSSQGDKAGLESALAELRKQLEDSQNANSDLQQDNYDLQDQLQEKLNLLSTTLAEKDQLRDAVRNQMLRSNGLVEGVLGLDNTYYASRHQDENPVTEDASDDERFYHDFDVGAKIIDSLSAALEQLRTITDRLGDGSGDQRSLEKDLELLTQLKAGSLTAMDAAAPISGLIEALHGACRESNQLDEDMAGATGGHPQPIAEPPDADGEPAQVLTGATTVVRQMAAQIARDRLFITALKQLTDEADNARAEADEESERLKDANRRLIDALAAKAKDAKQDVPAIFEDDQATVDARLSAALGVVDQLGTASADELAEKDAALARLRSELEYAQQERTSLAARVKALEHAAAEQQQHVAQQVIEAARGDDHLTDAAADLSLGIDPDGRHDESFAAQVTAAVAQLARRKQDLERQVAGLAAERESAQATVAEAEQSIAAERAEIQRLRQATADAQAATTAATDDLATSNARVEHMRRELDQTLVQVRVAQDDAQAAKAEVSDALAKVREMEAKHAERIRVERVLAGEVITAAKSEASLADIVDDLSVAIDDQSDTGLHAQLHQTVSALAQRSKQLAGEQTRLTHESNRFKAEAGDARRRLGETQRAVALAVVEAAKGDEDLASTMAELQWHLDRLQPGEAMPDDAVQKLSQALAELSQRKADLQAERDEMALHGKEIITALTASRDQRETELKALKVDHEAAANRLAMIESRTAAAEDANRQLAEALSQAAAQLPAGEDEARIDLELAMSQLPEEGEDDIEPPADAAPQLAAHGSRVASALANRVAALTAALEQAQTERARVEQQSAERASQTTRYSNELGNAKKELAEAKAQLESASTEITRLNTAVQGLRSDSANTARQLAEARTELDRANERQLTQNDELSLRSAEIEGLKVRIGGLERDYTLSQAEIAEFSARSGTSADGMRGELVDLRQQVGASRDALSQREAEIQTLREKAEAADAKARRLRDEFSKRLEERDLVIQEKDRQLDAIGAHRGDLSGLQAEVTELNRQLTQANAKISELESLTGQAAGASSRSSTVSSELKRAQADRDLLREQKRSLEGDLAEANSLIDELKAQTEERRRELALFREQTDRTLADERQRAIQTKDELAKFRAEVVGLQSKLRKLTEGK